MLGGLKGSEHGIIVGVWQGVGFKCVSFQRQRGGFGWRFGVCRPW